MEKVILTATNTLLRKKKKAKRLLNKKRPLQPVMKLDSHVADYWLLLYEEKEIFLRVQ